jgi:hypothetical protein
VSRNDDHRREGCAELGQFACYLTRTELPSFRATATFLRAGDRPAPRSRCLDSDLAAHAHDCIRRQPGGSIATTGEAGTSGCRRPVPLGPLAATIGITRTVTALRTSGPRSASRILLGVSFSWPARECSTPERTVKTRSRPTASDPRIVP